MKSLLTNPISTRYQFAAGGDRIPIQTRASALTTKGYNTQGFPKDNRTTLGAYRMGDTDGNAAPSAIYPGEIFAPIPTRDRQYKQITFENVGNRVFQPEDDTHKLHALLKALGDQKFKYDTNAPFADYFATQRLAREADESSRNAGLEDLGHSREILRNLVDMRRKQANDDYMRKMLDAGMTLEDAEDELEAVRRANALQEAKKVEDRTYQSKLLLSRIAQSRGITPNIKEPLTSTSAIEDPQRSQALASALGEPGTGFGTAPLDTGRMFMTPEFYKRFLRRTRLTQESADEQAAIANLISEGGIDPEQSQNITNSAVTAATLSGNNRENTIESIREMYANRLQSMRKKKILLPLAPVIFGQTIIERVYNAREKSPGEKARFSVEVIDDLPIFQKIVAINQSLALDKSGDKILRLRQFLQPKVLTKRTTRGELPADNIRDILTEAARLVNNDEPTIRIPFVGENVEVGGEMLVRIFQDFQGLNRSEIDTARREARAYADDYEEIDLNTIVPEGEPLTFRPGEAATTERSAVPLEVGGNSMLRAVSTIVTGEQPNLGAAASSSIGARQFPNRRGPKLEESVQDKKTLVNLAESLGLSVYGTKKKIIQRIRESGKYTEVSGATNVDELD